MSSNLGYYFCPSADPQCPGFAALEVHLAAEPTLRHFDPESVTLPTASRDGGLGHLVVGHPWSGPERISICAGHIVLRDRRLRSVEAFSFGGVTEVREGSDATHCTITSPAPILELVPSHLPGYDAATWLATSVEALIASRRARWARNEAEFARRLATSDPEALYVAFLAEVDRRMRGRPLEHTTLEERAGHRLVRDLLSRCGAPTGQPRPTQLSDLL